MKIAFFISNHGFGHLMRNLPVMEELLRRGHEVLLITGQKQADAVMNPGIVKIIVDTDAGLVVSPGTIKIDQERTIKRVQAHTACWDDFIENSPNAEIYVVDIVPWALLAALKKGIPSVLMASFTWVEQYESFLPDNQLDLYIAAFKSRDRVLYYELVNAPTKRLLGDGVDIGFVSRQTDLSNARMIRNTHQKPIVLITLGMSNSGLAQEINVNNLPYSFITTSALRLIGDNVEVLPESVPNIQDYICAADYCIAKSGWSTVSEMMLAGVPSALFERPDVPEDTMIINELVSRGDAISCKISDLNNLESIMPLMKPPKNKYNNNISRVADLIEETV